MAEASVAVRVAPLLLLGRSAWQLFGNFFADQADSLHSCGIEKGPVTRAFAVGAGVSEFTR
jgi:hypothetical protein